MLKQFFDMHTLMDFVLLAFVLAVVLLIHWWDHKDGSGDGDE